MPETTPDPPNEKAAGQSLSLQHYSTLVIGTALLVLPLTLPVGLFYLGITPPMKFLVPIYVGMLGAPLLMLFGFCGFWTRWIRMPEYRAAIDRRKFVIAWLCSIPCVIAGAYWLIHIVAPLIQKTIAPFLSQLGQP